MAAITIPKGTTYAITFTYKRDGVAADLTGATVYFTIKSAEFDSDADDSDALIKKDVTVHTDAESGETEITLSPTDTNVVPGDYFYDIKVKEADGDVYKAVEGKVKVDGSPTNRSTA